MKETKGEEETNQRKRRRRIEEEETKETQNRGRGNKQMDLKETKVEEETKKRNLKETQNSGRERGNTKHTKYFPEKQNIPREQKKIKKTEKSKINKILP